jgi:hypothetical protein
MAPELGKRGSYSAKFGPPGSSPGHYHSSARFGAEPRAASGEDRAFVVSGAEGRYLRQKQDDAIRSTLRWFAENRPQDAGLGALTAVPPRPMLTNDVLFGRAS